MLRWKKSKSGEIEELMLREQGVCFSDILERETRRSICRENSNVSYGGDSIDVSR
ncbi:MAG: hypothetical protein U5K84_01265 [Alkalibacterium sp.]|nr:hypothetical protein [Alkalibacterium sp.]